MTDILIVEDDNWLIECYRCWLSAAGYSVKYAPSAQTALDLIDEDTPKMIILDMFLPAANGMQFLNELRSHSDWINIPVLICSGVTLSQVDGWGGYGVEAVVNKSDLTPKYIIQVVEEILQKYASN